MNGRLLIVALISVSVGFAAGVSSGLFVPDGHFASEVKLLREENAALTKMVELLKAERAEVQAVLGDRK